MERSALAFSVGTAPLPELRRITLTERQRLDLEQILCGGFAPLSGFLNEKDYDSVVLHSRLSDGTLFPIPIVLDTQSASAPMLDEKVILCDIYGDPIAFFTILSIYQPDKSREARLVYGTESLEHPGVRYLMEDTGNLYLGGPVELIRYSPAHDFKDLRFRPNELKKEFQKRGWDIVVAFQTRNPIHRAHYEIIMRALKKVGGKALVHPVTGPTKEGDIDYVTRVRSYKRLAGTYFKDHALLALLPIAMRMAGPREAIWHALIRKNYGATHFIVGRDHAGAAGKNGAPFYGPYAAQAAALQHERALSIKILPTEELVYVEAEQKYMCLDELGDRTPSRISGTQFRAMLRAGKEIPAWFSFPEVVEELRRAMAKEKLRGTVVFFTGYSGAGKSTIALRLYHALLECSHRSVTLLDGDVVRNNLSRGLGFSKEDRNINIERIGFVAGEIAKHGGIALCAAIAPYAHARAKNRRLIAANGTYIEVFIDTPLSICEKRDPKGLYKKARSGNLKDFTGVDDAYEAPEDPDIRIDTTETSAEAAAARILTHLSTRELV